MISQPVHVQPAQPQFVNQPVQPLQTISQPPQTVNSQPVQYIQQPVQYVQSQPEPVYQTVYIQPAQPVQLAQPNLIQRQQSLPVQPQQYQVLPEVSGVKSKRQNL